MKQVTFIFLMFVSMIAVGQSERTSVALPVIANTPKTTLLKANGWGLHENGQWISEQNKIPALTETVDEVDNFVSYDLRDIRINDTLYTLFIKKYKTGWFTYPSIYSGWNSTIDGEFFVFKKSDIDSLKIIGDSINLIKIKTLYWGGFDNVAYSRQWNESVCMNKIKTDITKQISGKKVSDMSVVFHIAPYKSKNIVRFQIYSLSGAYNLVWSISNEYKPKDPNGKYSWDELKIYGTNKLFEFCYYEIDYSTFDKFMKLP
jgi:hypothetical protein